MIKALFSLFLISLFSLPARGVDFSVMTFNTMCDFCHKTEADTFSKRKVYLKEVLEDHRSDLIAIQEARLGSQVEELFEKMPEYELYYTDSLLMSYADPAIAVNTNKFKVLDKGQFWLGPKKGDFSLGWKFALPRQALWVKVKSLEDGKELVFISSHFDNRVENMLGSADMTQEFIQKQNLPALFAGDTNCVEDFKGYKRLVGDNLVNAYDIKENFQIKGVIESDKDLCYTRKGSKFPQCRVDHVLLSKAHAWKVLDWIIDARRFGEQNRFPSDHRAVINKLSL